jgi:hypothetical protein
MGTPPREKKEDSRACTTQLGKSSIRGKDQLRKYPSRIYHQSESYRQGRDVPKGEEGFIVLDESHYFVSPTLSTPA